jgi:hypothetical protein
LDLAKSLAALRRLCPTARDTVIAGQETLNPAVVFHLGTLRAIGIQYGDSLTPDAPAEFWIVAGSGGRLPRGLSLDAKWRQRHRAYGQGVASWQEGWPIGRVMVELWAPRHELSPELRLRARPS